MRGIVKSVFDILPDMGGRSWLTVAIETTDRGEFLRQNTGTIETLAHNVAEHGVTIAEATKAAQSQLVFLRATACRASAITPEFRPWTREEIMKGVAAQNKGIKPKDVLEWVGRNPVTEKVDRKKIYRAQFSDSIGRRWTNAPAAVPVYLRSALEYWTTTPDKRIPPLCLLTEGAIVKIFTPDFNAEQGINAEETIRQTFHRARLYRPKGLAFSYDGEKFSPRKRI